MARRLGSLGRPLLAVVVVAVVGALAFQLLVRESTAVPRLVPPRAAATLGEGDDAIAVGPNGAVLEWLALEEAAELPRLPLDAPPPNGRLQGTVLEQAQVLGAAPAPLRPYIERSYYGESGIDVVLRSGIELRFGDATQATRKWQAAAVVLADPSISALDYVDLRAPRRPAVDGSGHALPPLP
ncbi:MAG TPA: cell division protein FtsQ/DivIB [Solirubrobacterales bacterium]|nr:cell division protein FtsQ/DivIB [Solirubrobacterales bacterium]